MIKELFKYEVFFVLQLFYVFLLSILKINEFTLKNIVFLSTSLLIIAFYTQLYITYGKLEYDEYKLASQNDLTILFVIETIYILSIISLVDFQTLYVGVIELLLILSSLLILYRMNKFRAILDLRLFLDFHHKVLREILRK